MELDLGITKSIEFGEHVIIGLDKKFLKLTNGKPLEFHAKINEDGQLVLLGPLLMKPSKTGVENDNDT